MFKVGDVVTPKKGYVAEGYMFKIIDKYYESFPSCIWKYKLQRITQQLKIEEISANALLNEIRCAEETLWIEDELNFEYRYNETNDAVDALAYATQVMGVPINQVNITGDSIQVHMPTPDKPQEIKNKKLFDIGADIAEYSLQSITKKGSIYQEATSYVPIDVKYYKDVNFNSLKANELLKTNNELLKFLNNKEEKEMDILKLYEGRKGEEIAKNYRKERERILKEDEIQSIIIETQNQVNTILENQNLRDRLKVDVEGLHTAETEKKLEELKESTDAERAKLRSTLDEIRALFEMTDNYEERIKILKNYNILDKNRKLSV